MRKLTTIFILLSTLYANIGHSLPADSSGIAVNNHANNIEVAANSTLYANVGNSQNAQVYTDGFSGTMRLSDGNSVSNVRAGNGATITNNVGNAYNTGTDTRNLTNNIGNLTVGDNGTLINNIGATINNNQQITTRDTVYNTTNVTQLITNNFIVDGRKSDLGPLGAVLITMLGRLQEIAGKVKSVTFSFHADANGGTDLTKPFKEATVPLDPAELGPVDDPLGQPIGNDSSLASAIHLIHTNSILIWSASIYIIYVLI